MSAFEPTVAVTAPDPAVELTRAAWDRRCSCLGAVVQPRIAGHLHAYQLVIDDLANVHAAIADQTDLDLSDYTRPLAIWEMSGRAISLAHALIDQLRREYAAQTVGTARLMHESTVLLEAFLVAPPALVSKWLDGEHIPQRDARAEQGKLAVEGSHIAKESGAPLEGDPRYRALVASLGPTGLHGDADPETVIRHIAREEYREFSHERGGHNDRQGLTFARTATLRRFVYGRQPDPLVRAEFVEEAGHDIERVLISVGYAFARVFLGSTYQTEHIHRLQAGLDAVRRELPLDRSARASLTASL